MGRVTRPPQSRAREVDADLLCGLAFNESVRSLEGRHSPVGAAQ